MTRRESRDVSERGSGIGKNEREPVVARLVVRRRRSILERLITLRKGNHWKILIYSGRCRGVIALRRQSGFIVLPIGRVMTYSAHVKDLAK